MAPLQIFTKRLQYEAIELLLKLKDIIISHVCAGNTVK